VVPVLTFLIRDTVRVGMHRVGVVGGGAAGACAAHALRDVEADVTVFERHEGVGGRATARRRGGCIYDYGANYLRDDDERVAQLVAEGLDATGLVDIPEPVWTFDRTGTIEPGEDRDGRKWTYRDGLSTLGERVLGATDATVYTGAAVETLVRDGDRWRLRTAGDEGGPYDALVVTPPAPATGDLLLAAEWDAPAATDLSNALHGVSYRSIYSAVLHYPVDVARPDYALVNVDGKHAVSWLSREECKPGHVPDGESLLVVQMADGWTRRRSGDAEEALLATVAASAAELLEDDRLRDPDWGDGHAWPCALVEEAVDPDIVEHARDHDLYFAGDWVAGEARIHAALRSGMEAGERLIGDAGRG
jgi:predicted NAD/FAD-dependent oxidoreductase